MFIDLHCHSALKPYSKSFKNPVQQGKNSANPEEEHSVWHMDHEVFIDKVLNTLLSVTKFTQADFKTSYGGGVKIMMVSIDPMEKALVFSKRGNRQLFTGQLLKNFVIGLGRSRIKHLFELKDYFADMEATYAYLEAIDGKEVSFDDKVVRYKLVDSYGAIDLNDQEVIHIIMTIEGGHVFNTGLELANRITDANEVLANIQAIKSEKWKVKPFFVALAHHFPNQLCGHAKSFKGISSWAYRQQAKKNEGITLLGKAVIKALLDKGDGAKRVYIDLKHMNPKSRFEFYDLMDAEPYKHEDIPLIVSHGALKFRNRPAKDTTEINFYNEEILKIAHSGGIFGVQLDERRLLKRNPAKKVRDYQKRPKRLLYRKSYYVWRQIEAMACLLYQDKTFEGDCWGIQAIGSDFDGIIDPLNGFWTHSHFKDLAHYLKLHAHNFLYSEEGLDLPDRAKLTPEAIINKFCFENANAFLKRYLE